MQNETLIENYLRDCFQSFMAIGKGPIECAHCPTFKLCALWKKEKSIRVLIIGEDVIDADSGEVYCQTI